MYLCRARILQIGLCVEHAENFFKKERNFSKGSLLLDWLWKMLLEKTFEKLE